MSTTIYNGFKFNTNIIDEVHFHMTELRKEFKQITDSMLLEQMTEECFSIYDRRTMTPSLDRSEPVMNVVVNEMYKRQEEVRVKQIRNPSIDFSFEICVFPHDDQFYAQFFTEQGSLTKILKDKDYYEDFVYWNNVDEPTGMDSDEWEARGQTWNEILEPVGYVPSRAGFTYEIVPLSGLINLDSQTIIDNAPGIIVRAERIAKDNVYKKFAANRKINTTNVMKIYNGFVQHIKSEKGTAELKLETEFVAKNLKLVLTTRDLTH